MIDATAPSATEFVELRFRPGTWERKGLPEQGCWIRATDLETMLEAGGTFTVTQLAHCLIDWLAVTDDATAAKRTLCSLLDRNFPSARSSTSNEYKGGE